MDDPPRLRDEGQGDGPGNGRRPFVGRTRELAWLARCLDDASSGTPRIAWIEGHSGIGKTQLVRRFLRGAPAHQLITASGEELEASLSFGVLDQLWSTLGTRPSSSGDEDAPDPLLAGAELLAAIGADDRPTVLLVDDLQWIDADSARALLFLLRRLQVEPLLVLLLCHPGTDLRLGPGWTRLLRDPDRVATLRLEGLDVDELEQLLRASVHEENGRAWREDARRLHQHTAGHPLHASALLTEVGPDALRDQRSVLPVPRSLTAAVAARLDGLDADTRRLLGAGAVLGRRFAPELAGMIAAVDEPFAHIDHATAAQVVDRQPDGSVAFAHLLLHTAVYSELPAAERRALHLAAAGVTSGSESLDHRVLAATGPDSALVADLVAAAREAESVGQYSRAADHLEAASRLSDTPAQREALVLDALECVHVAGDFVRAEAMRPAVEACAPGPRRTGALGLLAYAAGHLAQADELLAATTADGVAPSERWQSRATTTLALIRLQRGDWVGAIDAADAVIAAGGAWDRSVAQFAAIFALAETGRSDDAAKLLQDASPGPNDRAAGALDVLAGRGLARMLSDDVLGAIDDLTAVTRRARSGEPIRLHELALANLGDLQQRIGRWDDAAFSVELAATMAADSARGAASVRAHTAAAAIDAQRGRLDEAVAHLREAAAVPGADDSHLTQLLLAMAGASIASARGDGSAMLAELAEPFDGELHPVAAAAGPSFWRAMVVEALLAAGDLDGAEDAFAYLADFQAGVAIAPHHFDCARLRGGIAAARGDDEPALAHLEAGIVLEDDRLAGSPARARLLAEHGRTLLRLGRPRDAVGSLRAARAVFARLGAAPELDRCDQDLARCGLPTRGDAPAPLALTDAEAKVAKAVAEGLTNREVAELLYVSTKTVEYHLRNIFTKLGITSRRQIRQHLDGVLV